MICIWCAFGKFDKVSVCSYWTHISRCLWGRLFHDRWKSGCFTALEKQCWGRAYNCIEIELGCGDVGCSWMLTSRTWNHWIAVCRCYALFRLLSLWQFLQANSPSLIRFTHPQTQNTGFTARAAKQTLLFGFPKDCWVQTCWSQCSHEFFQCRATVCTGRCK